MKMMRKKFIELIQISIGKRDTFSTETTAEDWYELWNLSRKHAIAGVLFDGIKKVGKKGFPQIILFSWIALVNQIEAGNDLLDTRVVELQHLFAEGGFRTCILKGQGISRYYTNPKRRQTGDIDIWVEGERDDILHFLKSKGTIGLIDIKHCDWQVFEDVTVEVHFIPTLFCNPILNNSLQLWFARNSGEQFNPKENEIIHHPSIEFNLVYSLIHIYRHLFEEGIGLRQLMDYYYVLIQSTRKERAETAEVLYKFQMKRFLESVMYVMQLVFGLNSEYLIGKPNEQDGLFLLDEILQAGNFGKYDLRNRQKKTNQFWYNGWLNFQRNFRFIRYYPQEVLWIPIWKLWHYFWRKRKGYL